MLSLAQRPLQLLNLEIYKQASTDIASWPLELSKPDEMTIASKIHYCHFAIMDYMILEAS